MELDLLLKPILKEQSLSLRQFSEQTGIDKATMSRIITGKRKATPEHLHKIAKCLNIPLHELYSAAGYPIETEKLKQISDIHSSIDSIQHMLTSSELLSKPFRVEQVEKQLDDLKSYSQTPEGTSKIIQNFDPKLKKVGSIGPFINELKGMFDRFRLRKGTPAEIAIIGAVLIYFIIPVDVIPDYIFPLGYLDDAISVKLSLSLLITKSLD
jgi:uncharacterized membrane protein YkvA (DUF1232 family)/DNA-binding Xre family transcriptional regulator